MIDNYIKDVVSQEIKKAEILKHIPATVVEVVENTNNGKAIVLVMGRKLTLLNKTGEILEKNDAVIIHYWDNIANGYIALRCGLPRPAGGLYIKNAVTVTKPKSKIEDVSEYVGDVYSENKYKNTYDTAPEIFYVNGCPAYLTKYLSQGKDPAPTIDYSNNEEYAIGIKNELRSIDIDLFSQSVSIKKQNTRRIWTDEGYVNVITLDDETYYTHISYSNNIQSSWAHRIGLYSQTDDTFFRQCDNVYFHSLNSFDRGGIIIVCTNIYPFKTEHCPYGYINGFLAVRYDGGRIYNNGMTYLTDLIHANTFFWTIAFASSAERDYTINLTNRDRVIPSTYNG